MRQKLFFALLLFICPESGIQAQLKMTAELFQRLNAGERPSVLILMEEQADLQSEAGKIKGKQAKAAFVFRQLQSIAEHSQENTRKILREIGADFNSLWIVNALAVDALDLETAERLAQQPEVRALLYDPWTPFGEPVEQSSWPGASDRDNVEWNLSKIGAPEAWAMGYSGKGITVGGADTGVEWFHPSIRRQYRGWTGDPQRAEHSYNWFDGIRMADVLHPDPKPNSCGFRLPFACDDHNHGTHTVGTMVGDDGQGDHIGVAPEARWVACRNMDRGWGKPSTYLNCFQWFLAPTDLDGRFPDPALAPHVINNSWYCSEEEGCTSAEINELLRIAVVNLRASGVFVVVSNGNFGPDCATTNHPPQLFEESFCVGSTQRSDTISKFSSRGPVVVDSSYRAKPNVCAPGDTIRSCIRQGYFASWSGTSMAGPHVAGMVALILSARPDLAGEVELLEDLVESTCVPLDHGQSCQDPGSTGANMIYGHGRIDARAAVLEALKIPLPPVSPAENPHIYVFPNPVNQVALLHYEGMPGSAQFRIFDLSGRRMAERELSVRGNGAQPFSVEHLESGIYFWRLEWEGGSAGGKFVKA